MSAQHMCPVYISAIRSLQNVNSLKNVKNVNQDYFSNGILQKQCILIHVYTEGLTNQKVNAILYAYTL